MRPFIRSCCAALAAATALIVNAPAAQAETLGTSLPADFPVIVNPYLGVPILGFGARGPVHRVPVIFVHGNNDSPFATACNPFGYIHNMGQYFLDHGYRASELWGIGYQGDQCDLAADQTHRSGVSHSTAAAVPLLDMFIRAVMRYTGSDRVDIVGHSLGVPVVREWMFEHDGYRHVRAFVAMDGPNHGIIDCSPDPANYYQAPASGGFVPNSAVCQEYGSDHTELLSVLNAAGESHGPTRYLVLRNVARATPESGDFVYLPGQDGVVPGVPAEDRDGNPHDFSDSALLAGSPHVDFVGQGVYDPILGTSHLGLLNSPYAWQTAFSFLRSWDGDGDPH